MSNPYTSVSVSGYNASPPDDDGSEVSTNQLKWSNHKDKLGDPLKTALESINTNVTAAFGLSFGTTISSHSGNYTVLAADRGRFLEATAALTFTLPAVADAGVGFPLVIVNNSTGDVTIDGSGDELVNGVASIVLYAGEFVLVTTEGTVWKAVGNYTTEGSFAPNLTGFSADPTTPLILWRKQGQIVHVKWGFTTGTSNSADFDITNWPTALQPANAQIVAVSSLTDNGSEITGVGTALISASATLAFGLGNSLGGGFTTSAAKGFANANASISYSLWP